MKIKDLFQKSIDRDIQGVIKVGQEDNTKQELEEYVVTNELQSQFARFFSAYEDSLTGSTDDMGVWISGFFGSGKSHFLKVIADVLENREVDGKRAVDYFEGKIKDQMTLNQMHAAAESDTQVILFNIDAKAMSGDKADDNVIVKVFLQVFNAMQGFSDKSPWIADLERRLVAAGKYDEFKQAFSQIEDNHLDWEDGRDHYYFNMGKIRDALVSIDFMSQEDAQGFIDQLKTPYQINVEDFAELVNDYVQKTGHRVAFLVDEVGQFVGDSLQRMLNLQTVVEELGRVVKGKAWVVVTSQQDIAEVTNNVNGQDFSKIQGRFKTRIALSSANVDEVIKKRLLAKTPEVEDNLKGMYVANGSAINNAIDFDQEGVKRLKYDSPESFANNYPFVPYQFNLLQQVLTAIRTHGSEGKHLSEGERSMLSIFQESAIRMEDRDVGALIPFSLFFEGLEQFLDHTHRIVIEHAREDDQVINPKKERNPFAIQVLKTLFMVKYVTTFKATLNNIVTLMIDSTDVDKIELTRRVQEALNKLVSQQVVEKNMDTYVFLTDTEQDINKEIEQQQVSDAEIINKLGEFLFDTKVIPSKYSYPKLNGRYIFSLNEYIDDTPMGKTNNALSIRLLSTLNLEKRDQAMARLHSAGAPTEVVILLTDQDDYISYIRRAEKIQRFRMSGTNNTDSRYRSLVDARAAEHNELLDMARTKAIEALHHSSIFVGGNELDKGRDFAHQLDAALQSVVDDTYRNLSYIDAAKGEKDVLQVLKSGELVDTSENKRAVEAVIGWLQREKDPHITLKRVIDRFHEIPFGYTEEDVEWIVGKLYAAGKIKLTYNGEVVSRVSGEFNVKQIVDFLTKKQYTEKIALQIKHDYTPTEIKRLRQVASQVFKKNSFSSDNSEILVSELKPKIASDYESLRQYELKDQRYPGHDLLQKGIELLHELNVTKDSDQFFDVLSRRFNDLLDWREDFEDRGIADFYVNQNTQDIWDAGLKDLSIYEHSKEKNQ
ncbi:BREX system P-loop protein BrxC [Lacticaseibacillus camelliae]|uniref:BREX system P-loop protein BrxC n=1 Tax=Lacticaseibacillus camelliae TaxID=381742 RepID=UPI0006CF248A|nr:BREX system P-loop protein BrxC [Lacticaseibacillus camelliae]